jgi:hypothetical protein
MIHFKCRAVLLLAQCLFFLGLPFRGSAQIFTLDREDRYSTSTFQLGAKVAQIQPRNAFGKDFGRAPGYEFYVQVRYNEGRSGFSNRVGVFYADLQPRLDTIPDYLVRGNPTTVLPGYVCYRKFNLRGLYIDAAYTVVQLRKLNVDIGCGGMIGLYTMEYSEGYATVLTISDAHIKDDFVALRPKLSVGYRLGGYLQLYAEYVDVFATTKDWSMMFNHNSFGLGVNVSFNRSEDNE